MLEHILVAADFSPAWPRLQAQVHRLRVLGCRAVTLVHVMPTGYARAPGVGHRAHYEAQLQQATATLRPLGLTVDTEVRVGAVAQELLSAARAHGCGVIMVGTRGHSTLRDLLLGSTVLDLARLTDRPLLLAPTDADAHLPPEPVCRPLLATDASLAAAAAEAAFLHLAPQCSRGMVVSVGRWDEREEKGERLRVEQHLAALGRRAGAPGFDIRLPGQGRPAAEIARAAEESGADIVIVGKRGANPMKELLLGSTAEEVCRTARRLVLLVPGGA
ncbi:universal stress protein [Ectothiorhodospiraceae bacterium 2226]|nr:universal stress protein [Ectothiorhodospiraceae bacterium 2226]